MSEYLECTHCGGVAIDSTDSTYYDGQGDRCDECGFPGTVSVDDADDDEATAYWNASSDEAAKCTDGTCETCYPKVEVK